jgi:DNA mismatch repair protein MutL
MTAMQAPEIRQLSDDIANQIAAGEVIERPAAVVKELVENSLDAGATRVRIQVQDGGRQLIEVLDDGHGIQPEHLPVALSRHATSKLRDAADLFSIATLGFRGEALPSIAGVSEMELASCIAGGEGRLLRMRGAEMGQLEPCALPQGTRVTVRNLFWNVPARLKFLKNAATEAGHISDMVMRLALGHPRVAFRLEVNGREHLDLPGRQHLRSRIRSCFGKALSEGLLDVVASADSLQISGFIAHPSQAKPSTKRQFVFLNGRYLHDKLLVAAIRQGYEGFLEPRLHGVAFLHLDIDPSLVDVNVHPTKAEVRFRNSGEVFKLVSGGISRALAGSAGGFSLFEPATAPARGGEVSRKVVKPVARPTAPAQPAAPVVQERFIPQSPMPPVASSASSVPQQRTAEPTATYGQQSAAVPPAAATPEPVEDGLPSGVRQVVQLENMYLLVETDQGIRLVDQHALHEKALWLALDPAASDLGAGSQERLVPISVELTAAEVAQLEPLLPALRQYGIQIEGFGPTTLLVRAHPLRLNKLRWQAFLSDLATDGDAKTAISDLRAHLAHRAACRLAVKAGTRLEPHEQHELIRLLYRVEGLEHCPHGRPTTLDLPWGELERRFQR